jgi:peptidoglycan/xylan/chitin deacetylase (PgdA/CDA1 family)
MAEWPGGARGALSLSFDNLGEAAELELGAWDPDAPLGEHFTATRVLPALLDALGEREIAATFFVEGLNAELYPQALQAIAGGGHEVAYHAWRHEQWGELSTEEQKANLTRGIEAFRELGLEIAGMRPPGGGLGAAGLALLREADLRYASPAGEGAGIENWVALLPFQWQHVDAGCLLPPLTTAREAMTGSPDPVDPAAFLAYLEGEIERLVAEGGFMAIVLHLALLDWLGGERLGALLARLTEAAGSGDLWLSTCAEVAEHVLSRPSEFGGGTRLDTTSWAA